MPLTTSPETVIGLDDDEADGVLAALSNDSARRIVVALQDGPATVQELADRTDLTAQNVAYHLDKLAGADLVATDGTRGHGETEATVYVLVRQIAVVTDPDLRNDRRPLFAGLLVGTVLSLACLPTLLGMALDPLLSLQRVLLPLVAV